MTLPASGPLSISNFSVEMGQTTTYSATLSWIKANTKTGQESNSFSGYYGKAWYQNTMGGNCNNANNSNCALSNCNCGNIVWGNCLKTAINCANCDTRSWLQSNCNCACTYNCSVTSFSYNCNCNCACDCGGTCFLEGSLVWMADGSFKPIEQVKIGDKVKGGGNYINTVIAYDRPSLAGRLMYNINGEHDTTDEHAHFGPESIYAISSASFAADRSVKHMVTFSDGSSEYREPPYISPDLVTDLKIGNLLYHVSGTKEVRNIDLVKYPDTTQLFNLVLDGSRTYFVNGYLVSGWAGNFDYKVWR